MFLIKEAAVVMADQKTKSVTRLKLLVSKVKATDLADVCSSDWGVKWVR